jgi:uncharacterized membrane protein
MPGSLDVWIVGTALCIEMGGSLIVAFGCLRAVVALLSSSGATAGITYARLVIADAVLWGLSFKVAATLLKTTELRSWEQIGAFAAVLALRTLLKHALDWERRQLSRPPAHITAGFPQEPSGTRAG